TKGRLAYVEDTSGEEHTSYDARGRTEWTIKRIPDPLLQAAGNGPSQLVAYRTQLAYDSFDRIINMIYPDNDQVGYEYDARGLLQRITGGPSGSIVPSIGYTPGGQQEQIDCGNGVRTSYAYDSRQRLVHLRTASLSASPPQQLIDFG